MHYLWRLLSRSLNIWIFIVIVCWERCTPVYLLLKTDSIYFGNYAVCQIPHVAFWRGIGLSTLKSLVVDVLDSQDNLKMLVIISNSFWVLKTSNNPYFYFFFLPRNLLYFYLLDNCLFLYLWIKNVFLSLQPSPEDEGQTRTLDTAKEIEVIFFFLKAFKWRIS